MSLTDPIADYLTRIRNACQAMHSKVDIPSSNITKEMTRILQEEGYIRNFTFIEDHKQGILRIYLKYGDQKKSAISGIERVSRPGFRRYCKSGDVPRVLNGLGIAILTTPKGILTANKAKKLRIEVCDCCNSQIPLVFCFFYVLPQDDQWNDHSVLYHAPPRDNGYR